MSGAENAWELRRVGRTGDWLVLDRSTGVSVGIVFKYLGYWRAGSGQSKPWSTKEGAAAALWSAQAQP